MTENGSPEIEFEHDDFEFDTIEEEVRVDQRCQQVLKGFYQQLQLDGLAPHQASELAFCADLYVRDYLLDFGRQNLVRPEPGIVRRFAATWYITHTLDPEMKQLEMHLDAIGRLYRFLHERHLISREELNYLLKEAGELDYYRQRIDSFLAITADGYIGWEAECPAAFPVR